MNPQDRKEVYAIFDEALGKRLVGYGTEKAYGYPSDEAGTIRLYFEGGFDIELRPTGYDPDGISVDRL